MSSDTKTRRTRQTRRRRKRRSKTQPGSPDNTNSESDMPQNAEKTTQLPVTSEDGKVQNQDWADLFSRNWEFSYALNHLDRDRKFVEARRELFASSEATGISGEPAYVMSKIVGLWG
jgi:hypothetical protein